MAVGLHTTFGKLGTRLSEGWKAPCKGTRMFQRAVETYGIEALNAWPRSLHTRAVPGLFLERDLVGMWAQPKACWTTLSPDQSQREPRIYTS